MGELRRSGSARALPGDGKSAGGRVHFAGALRLNDALVAAGDGAEVESKAVERVRRLSQLRQPVGVALEAGKWLGY